jgi:hypothetical protein
MIWKFTPWFPHTIDVNAMSGRCSITNGSEVFAARQPPGSRWQTFPIAQLSLTLEDFDLDCFEWETYTFVSEHMKDAMALDASHVQFFDVDARQSAPRPRAKRYKIINVPVIDHVSDARKSSYLSAQLTPEGPTLVTVAHSIAIRPDAKPINELFHDRDFVGHIFCTDPLAVRVLEAACTGVRFLDPARLGIVDAWRFRTLRGIEEAGEWDPSLKMEHTTLVRTLG